MFLSPLLLTCSSRSAVWVVSIAAHFYAAANAPTSGGFDNVSPRGYLASITRKEKRTPQEELYIRAEAAQQNGFEVRAVGSMCSE